MFDSFLHSGIFHSLFSIIQINIIFFRLKSNDVDGRLASVLSAQALEVLCSIKFINFVTTGF